MIIGCYDYVNGALLMLSLTSNNTVCSSSKLLQKKQVTAKKKDERAPPTRGFKVSGLQGLWVMGCRFVLVYVTF